MAATVKGGPLICQEKIPPLRVLDFNHPEIWIALQGSGEARFSLVFAFSPGALRNPDSAVVFIAFWRQHQRPAIHQRNLDEHRPGIVIAMAAQIGEGAAQPGAADQSFGPDAGFERIHGGILAPVIATFE